MMTAAFAFDSHSHSRSKLEKAFAKRGTVATQEKYFYK